MRAAYSNRSNPGRDRETRDDGALIYLSILPSQSLFRDAYLSPRIALGMEKTETPGTPTSCAFQQSPERALSSSKPNTRHT